MSFVIKLEDWLQPQVSIIDPHAKAHPVQFPTVSWAFRTFVSFFPVFFFLCEVISILDWKVQFPDQDISWKFNYSLLSGASAAPTSDVRDTAVLVLLTIESKIIRRWNALLFHIICTNVHGKTPVDSNDIIGLAYGHIGTVSSLVFS
jgi:hypothetical protein